MFIIRIDIWLVCIPAMLLFGSCRAQEKEPDVPVKAVYSEVGGPCEGCEAVMEFGEATLQPSDTLPGFSENSPKLKVTGTVYEADGTTPAEGIILYVYHTDRDGLYRNLGGETGWGRRHGSYRGWIRTSSEGTYTFYTFRPASYPDRSEPEHIHLTIKEPGMNPYYLDSFHFTDDPLLTAEARSGMANRGGSGIVQPVDSGAYYLVRRDIVLGLNIPDYPKAP